MNVKTEKTAARVLLVAFATVHILTATEVQAAQTEQECEDEKNAADIQCFDNFEDGQAVCDEAKQNAYAAAATQKNLSYAMCANEYNGRVQICNTDKTTAYNIAANNYNACLFFAGDDLNEQFACLAAKNNEEDNADDTHTGCMANAQTTRNTCEANADSVESSAQGVADTAYDVCIMDAIDEYVDCLDAADEAYDTCIEGLGSA